MKTEMIEEQDTFKSCTKDDVSDLPDTPDIQNMLHSDTMCTEAFTPGGFCPTPHPLRPVAGADGYLSDPGTQNNNQSQYESLNDSKPYHYIPSKSSLYDMSLTPLEDISCITPSPQQGSDDGTTIKRRPHQIYPDLPHDDTFQHLTGDYLFNNHRAVKGVSIATDMTPRHLSPKHKHLVNTGTSPIGNFRSSIETQTGDKSLLYNDHMPPPPYNRNRNHGNNYGNTYGNQNVCPNNQYTSPQHTSSPPQLPPSIHNIPKQPSSELRWLQYSTETSLWESTETVSDEHNHTEFYSFNNNNSAPASKRPPVLDDFEHSWDNALNNGHSPDWALVEPQQWRIWFEFYKANSKVSKMRSLLVTTMMGTRDTCTKGQYVNPAGTTVPLPAYPLCNKILQDKSILHQTPICRFQTTEINVINADPAQVCMHLQNSGYKPALFVPANSLQPGGEWRTGGIGPLEEFIRRSSYYTCVDHVDGPVTERKRSGSLGLLSPTECQVNTNVVVFRESQQRNYTFLPHPRHIDVVSIPPLPKAKKTKEQQTTLTKEEVHLLKRKLAILFYSAATQGSDCLVLTPHFTEGRRVPHHTIAQIIESVCHKYSGMFKRVIIAIERDVIFHDLSKQVLDIYNKVYPEGHITLPSLPPLPSSQDIILWHWVGDNNNWYPYDPRQNEVIDAIYLRGETKMSMKGADSDHPGYVVDFNHFTVKSLSSYASRKIGRFKLVYDRIVKNKSCSRPVGNWVSALEDPKRIYETAHDETLQLKQTVAVWQWLNDENKWSDYTVEQYSKLESAYLQHGTACVILHINDTKFSVNTKSRIQTNTMTGKQRKVQRILRDSATSPRATSTPTPPNVKPKIILTAIAIWEHQGTDKSWLPFDNSTSEIIERAYVEQKDKLTVVFNNQAYWIYLKPYNLLLDPKIMEEYEIRRTIVSNNSMFPTPATAIKPQQLFKSPDSAPKSAVTPVSNSTMIEDTQHQDSSAMFTTATDFTSVLQHIENKPKWQSKAQAGHHYQHRQRTTSSDSVKYDGSQNRMLKTFMRHPSVMTNVDTSLARDPSREFSWEWQDTRTGLWHSLPEFISCFLEPASKTQGHGGVRTSKLTQGQQQITVRADFNVNKITGHLPGRPDVITHLRRVEVCQKYT